MARNRSAEKSHQRPGFREGLMHRGEQRENPISLLGYQDRHWKRKQSLTQKAHKWEKAIKCLMRNGGKKRERSCKRTPNLFENKTTIHLRACKLTLEVCQIYVHCNLSQDLTPKIATQK